MRYLPGSERFQRPSQEKIRVNSVVDRANKQVPVIRVLNDLWNSYVPSGLGHRSWKTFCPLGWEHPDGGLDKGFRVYESTNTAYCFVMHGSMGPVRLAQMRWGGKQERVAYRLLEAYGLGKRPWRERYEELLATYETTHRPGAPSNVVEALQVRLSTEAGYAQLQYFPAVVTVMDAVLEGLDVLYGGSGLTEEKIRQWYESALEEILAVVREVSTDAPG